MGGEADGVGRLFERKTVADQWPDIHLARENQPRHFPLQQKICRVAADEIFFIHADSGEIEGHFIAAFGMGKEQHLAAGAHYVLALPHYRIGRNRDDGGVHAATSSDSLDGFGKIASKTGQPSGSLRPGARLTGRGTLRRRSIDAIQPSRTVLPRQTKPGLKAIGGQNLNSSQCQQTGEHLADRPLAGDEHGISRQQRQPVDGFEHGIDGLEHGSFHEVVSRWNFDHTRQHKGHDTHVFRVAAPRRFETCGDADFFVLRALGESAVTAEVALQARHVMMQSNSISDFESLDLRSRANNGPGRFVPEDSWRRQSAVFDFLNVSRANATSGDFYQELA